MKVEDVCLRIERNLSWAAQVPILGNVAAVLKIALAVLQGAIGFLFAFVSAPFALCNEDAKHFCKRSATHIIHGGANFLAGFAELVCGIMSYEHRDNGHQDNEQYDKFVAYEILITAGQSVAPAGRPRWRIGRRDEVYERARNGYFLYSRKWIV